MNDDTGGGPGRQGPEVLPSVGEWKTETVDSVAPEDRGGSRLRRRRLIVLVIVAAVVVATGGGLVLATQIKSPAQQAAETRPPPLTELSASVQRTVLTTTVLGQAVVSAPREFSVSTAGGGDAGGGGGGSSAGQDVQQIVTRVFQRKGSYVGQGSVLFEVAGQPFFLLQGTVPAYRNLQPGETGQDVVQLQNDLQAMGYSVGGDTSGDFGPGTAAAVSAYYKAIGYQAAQVTTGPRGTRGAFVPLGEYAFVPQLPARVVKLGATVGKAPSGSMTLALGHPGLAGQLNPSEARLVRPGMPVTITEPGGGPTIGGRVTSVSNSTASKASISGGLYVAIGVRPDRQLPMSLVGQDVSLTVASARSAGPVLAVPEAAVFAGADGGTYVTKLVGAARIKVAVRVGMSGSGLLQVTPLSSGALSAGDRVAIGVNYSAGGTAGIQGPG
jgi:peptidoglycan hydrolase-like protein with peptidoglycan-binding domain